MARPRRRAPLLRQVPLQTRLASCLFVSVALALSVAAVALWQISSCKATKIMWPRGPKRATPHQLRKLQENAARLPTHPPKDGQAIAPEKTNIGVADRDRLAALPWESVVDRCGKRIKDDETVGSDVPFSVHDASGQLSSGKAPESYEEYAGRYKQMDKTLYPWFGVKAVKTLRTYFEKEDGSDDYRALRTYAWAGSEARNPVAIMLVGVTSLSARSRRLAARAVFEAEPTGLLVQLCREKLGRHLIMPQEHLATVAHYARGYSASNPHKLRQVIWAVDAVNGDWEALNLWMSDLAYAGAVDEFIELPDNPEMPKTLCLGDVHKSRLEDLRKHCGNRTLKEIPTLTARGKQVARGLVGMAEMGHRKIVGIVHVDVLPTVTTWLERIGAKSVAVADAIDLEEGHESITNAMSIGMHAAQQQAKIANRPPVSTASVLSLGSSRVGAFLNKDALEFIKQRKERLKKVTRVKDLVAHIDAPKVWKVAEMLSGAGAGTDFPGPESRLPGTPKKGLRFEWDHLEIPDHYLRDVGMEDYAPELWHKLQDEGSVLETRDIEELLWWGRQGDDGDFVAGEAYEDAEVVGWGT